MTFDSVLEITNGRNQKAVENPNGKYPIYGSGGKMGYADEYLCEADTVVIGRKGSINSPIYVEEPFWNVDTAFGLQAKREMLLPRYLFYFCKHFDFKLLNKTVTIPSLTKADLKKIKIHVPEMKLQHRIADTLQMLEDVIQHRQKQLAKLDTLVKARFVEMFGDPAFNRKGWPVVTLDTVCTVGSSKRIYQNEQSSTGVPFLRMSDLVYRMDTGLQKSDLFIPKEKYKELKENGLVPEIDDILVTSRGTLGRCYVVSAADRFYFQDGMISWLSQFSDNVSAKYIAHLFAMPGFQKQIDSLQAGSTVAYLSIVMLKRLGVILPPVELQSQFITFVAQVDKSKFCSERGSQVLQNAVKCMWNVYMGGRVYDKL